MHRPKVLNRKHVRVIALLTFGFYVLSAVLYSYGAGHGYGRFVGHLSNTLGIPKIAHALGRFAATVALPFAIKEIGLLGSVTRPLAEKLLGHAIRGTNLSLGLAEVLLGVAVPIYFLPTIISVFRKKRWFLYLLGNVFLVPMFLFPWLILMYFALV